MKFNEYIQNEEYPILAEYILICERTSPIPNDTFVALKSAGDKLGIRLKKSDTIWDYLKTAGKNLNDLMTYMGIYLSTDITNKSLKKKIVRDMKRKIKSIDKKEIAAFLIQLDKTTFGITSHIRHIMQSILGIEVSTYNRWLEDFEYMEKELKHVRIVLKRIGASEKEINALDNFENVIMNLKGEK